MIAHERAHHARPRRFDGKNAGADALELVTASIQHNRLNAKERQCGGACCKGRAEGHGRDHVAPCFSLPPRVHNGTTAASDNRVIPAPRIRVNGLSDGTKHPQRRHVPRPDLCVAAHGHERPDDGGRRVKLSHTVLLHEVPEAVGRGMRGNAFENDLDGAVEQRPVSDVRVACDPPAVGRAPEHVALLVVEGVPATAISKVCTAKQGGQHCSLERGGRVNHVACRRVHHCLRFAR